MDSVTRTDDCMKNWDGFIAEISKMGVRLSIFVISEKKCYNEIISKFGVKVVSTALIFFDN